MSDQVLIAIVAGGPGILAAVGTVLNIIMHGKTDEKINKLEKNTNGMQENLMKVSGQLEYKRGQDGTVSGFPEIESKK